MVRHRYSRAFGYEWRDNALSDPIQADVFHGERLRGTQVVPIRRNDTFRLRQRCPSAQTDEHSDIKKPLFSPTTAVIKSHITDPSSF
jgi:hypothetical protein